MWQDIVALSLQLEQDPGAVDDTTTKAAAFAMYRAHQLSHLGRLAVARGLVRAREQELENQGR